MVISGVISPLIWVVSIVTLLVTPLITTYEPPSTPLNPKPWMPKPFQAEEQDSMGTRHRLGGELHGLGGFACSVSYG